MNNDKDLLALKALAEKATPGPWEMHLSDNATPYITHGRCSDGSIPGLNDLGNRICVMPAEISTSYNSYANARLIAAANPDAILSLISRIEHEKRLRERAERALARAGFQDLGGEEWKPPLGQPPHFIEVPSQAVDLSGPTRWEWSRDGMGVIAADEVGLNPATEYVRPSDVQSLLSSAPVVREGKMTAEQEQQIDRIAARYSIGTTLALSFARSLFSEVFEREVLATGKLEDNEQYRMQMAGISTAALGYWTEADSIHPDYDTPALRDVAKLYAKYAALHAAATPSTPSQAWNGELPELPEWSKMDNLGNIVSSDVRKEMRDYARKAIGAAVAGVSLKARALTLDYAAMHFDGLGATSGAYASDYLRSLKDAPMDTSVFSSNPVSLREKAIVPEGYVLVPVDPTPEMLAAGKESIEQRGFCDCGNPACADEQSVYAAMLAAAPHPASNGNGEKGGAA